MPPGNRQWKHVVGSEDHGFEEIAMRTAVNWVKANCKCPPTMADLLRTLSEVTAAGVNCWACIGGALTNSGSAMLMSCFAGELFVFQLTDSQAYARGVSRVGMHVGRDRSRLPQMQPPARHLISLNRLEFLHQKLKPTTPFIGRVEYEVLASGHDLCARMDYYTEGLQRHTWFEPRRPMWGKGMLDVAFSPIASHLPGGTRLTGPLPVFVRLFDMQHPGDVNSRRPISNTVAALLEIV
jgi:hypothetical protein